MNAVFTEGRRMTGPRYFLVTNDARRTALVLWCHLCDLPPSIAVVDNPDLMLKIPDRGQLRCFWYGDRFTIAAWESWWTIRRLKGGFEWISEEDWATIMDWAERSRQAPTLALLHGAAPDADEAAASAGPAAGLNTAAEAVSPSAHMIPSSMKTVKKSSKWT